MKQPYIRHQYYIADIGIGPDGAYALMLHRDERDDYKDECKDRGFRILIDEESPLRSIRGFVRDARKLGIDVCFPLKDSELLHNLRKDTGIGSLFTIEDDFKMRLGILKASGERKK